MQRLLFFSFTLFLMMLIGMGIFFVNSTQTQAQAYNPTNIPCSNLDRPLLLGLMTNGQLNPEYADLISEVGGTAIKQNFNWDNIERVRGQYNFGGFDEMVQRATEKNLVIVANISGTPEWAKSSSLPPHKDLPRKEFTDDYKRFVTALMQRYPGIIAYEFWNEQNGCSSSIDRCGFNDQSVADYAYWLNATHQAVKAVDPSKLVVLGGLDGLAADDGVAFMQALHDKSGGRSYDIFSTHPYGNNAEGRINLAGVRRLHAIVQKPVWITEWGWDTNHPGEKKVTEEQQAIFTDQDIRELALPENSFIQAAFFATITDESDFVKMGLIKREGGQWVKKPAWQVFKNFSMERCPQANPAPPTPTPAPTPPTPAPQPPTNTPGIVQDVPITIRTHFSGRQGHNPRDGISWPMIAFYLNNGGNYQGLNDTADCTATNRPATCGTPNMFAEKFRGLIDVTSEAHVTDTVIPAPQLFDIDPATNQPLPTKLTYAYYNDYWDPNTNADRDVYLMAVEIFGPSGELLVGYTPRTPQDGVNFYFDMGLTNIEAEQNSQQNGMNNVFDKQLLFPHDHPDFNSVALNVWPLLREGSINIVSSQIPAILLERYPAAPPQPSHPGDYTNDCRVDIYDYNYVLENWQKQCPALNQPCVSTKQQDLDAVIDNFGSQCQQ